MQRDSRNLERSRGKEHAKAGTGKRTRRIKAAGNSARGRGHAIKSRPGSPHGIAMSEDAEAEDLQPDGQKSDARASAKPKRNVRKTSDVADVKKKQTRTTSPAKNTAKRRAKKAAKAEPADTKGGKRPPGTKPGRHQGMDVSMQSKGEATRDDLMTLRGLQPRARPRRRTARSPRRLRARAA